ncbi:hypothetical protein [Acinetobacter gerneri]|jgi:hypothetical protein|uniref:Uncharacterized protein n=2 Tax=Acinetobacter gerneri TaxID=202952 RepID=N8ZN62_9GAMM|nr:hypothetical protein [Acinetobacter gerneri]ENV33203.1 hypothetical protein F960_02569 [Acinetobacter gerneri DSM 14967 = CIP 107464 = MTCC 9824]MCH4245399.1 acyl-CoA thioesterase [Acinetobacter gerneri]MDQ9010511.1 acyl-CoA thioesterase [Acinetobacter gerneri]MDQ9014710.1 acyl-CoA thioesterase [Acinetobacter gerneri]MDQ9025815.1 acyl-CoA thioesterase [Acinetobacter gerneri]
MPSRHKRHKQNYPLTSWSTDQDCLLIEYNFLSLDYLSEMLPYSIDEINERKEFLGLNTNQKSCGQLMG